MSDSTVPTNRFDRRRALAIGGGVAGGLVAASRMAEAALLAPRGLEAASRGGVGLVQVADAPDAGGLPVRRIKEILQGPGTVSNGVLNVSLDRSDLGRVVAPHDIPFRAPFQLTHNLYFQPLGRGRAILNAEACLLPGETNLFIDKLIEGGLVFMSFHQHFFGLKPMVWFIHYRGVGDPIELARAAAAAIRTTATPLPQGEPSHTSPLNADRLARILGGDAEVEDGVVTVTVPRRETIRLADIPLKPETGVSHQIEFEPLDGDRRAVAGPDFALIGSEVNPVMRVMRRAGFEVHCLYNQETDEQPQLYFSHQLAVGDPYELARKIRRGLEQTNTAFKP